MDRLVQPEILDSLPHRHPDALANRADIARLNMLMGNYRWFASKLRKRRGVRVAELGAGDGGLGIFLFRTLPPCAVKQYVGIDLSALPPSWPERFVWLQADVLDSEVVPQCDCILANLFLHQFSDDELRKLGAVMAAAAAEEILISDLWRTPFHLGVFNHLVGPLLHRVTQHDGAVSIRAGFAGGEMVRIMGLEKGWSAERELTPLGGYRVRLRRI